MHVSISWRGPLNILFDFQLCQKRPASKKLPSLDELREATTLTTAGEPFDLEVLEVLGDSFLKFIVSFTLFLNKSV